MKFSWGSFIIRYLLRNNKYILVFLDSRAKKRKHKKTEKSQVSQVDEDLAKHGGWWKVTKVEDVTGSISIEFGKNSYISALDNGLFTIGAPHGDGEGPSPEEIFTAFPAGENKFALKSGYGKYLGVSKDGIVTGRSDAVGPMEQWEPVWQDGKPYLYYLYNRLHASSDPFVCLLPISLKKCNQCTRQFIMIL